MTDNFSTDDNTDELVRRLVATYTACGRIDHLNHCPLPSYRAIVEILRDLRELLFPGFGDRQNLRRSNIAYYVGGLIDQVRDRLGEQIGRALKHDCQRDEVEAIGAAQVRGREIAHAFLVGLVEIREMLADDVEAAFAGDPAARSLGEIVFCYPGPSAMTVHRIAHRLFTLDVPLIPRMMSEYAHSQTGIDIHPGAQIGRRFFIDHGTGVVIGETTRIGDDVKLYQGVTLGALSFPRDPDGKLRRGLKRHPTIEDNVVVYANATILGGETIIGHNAVIGSSVWLTQSVEPYARVTIESPKLRIQSPSQCWP